MNHLDAILTEASSLIDDFRVAISDGRGSDELKNLAWLVCHRLQEVYFRLPNTEDNSRRRTRELLQSFALLGASYVERPGGRSEAEAEADEYISKAATICTTRYLEIDESLTRTEKMRSLMWSLSTKARADDSRRDVNEDFELIECVNGGRSGVIWRGVQHSLNDRPVAVKVIRTSRELETTAREHAEALAKLQHPNIVKVYAFETIRIPESNECCPAVIMEWLEGCDLKTRLRQGNSLTLGESEDVWDAVIDGINHMHERGLTHGDLHPGNVFLTADAVVIIDVKEALTGSSTMSLESRKQGDVEAVRRLLQHVMSHTEGNKDKIASAERQLWETSSLEKMRAVVLNLSTELVQEEPEVRTDLTDDNS